MNKIKSYSSRQYWLWFTLKLLSWPRVFTQKDEQYSFKTVLHIDKHFICWQTQLVVLTTYKKSSRIPFQELKEQVDALITSQSVAPQQCRPHSVKLMSCKNSINAPPQCSPLSILTNILWSLFHSPSHWTQYFSPHSPLRSFSFLPRSNCSFWLFFWEFLPSAPSVSSHI